MKTKLILLIGCLLMPWTLAQAQDTSAAAPGANGFAGKVVDVTNTAGYTYVQVDTGAKKLWAVTTQLDVKPGDNVTVGPGMAMDNYHSKTLERDFDSVYFTSSITVGAADAGAAPTATPTLPPGHPAIGGGATPGQTLPPGHPSLTSPGATPNLDLTGIKKADGGKTVAEIYKGKTELAGKPVTVRGKVVKYNANIMGKNWLHIRDGSGNTDTLDNDLTITTSTSAALGDTVLVTGNVSTNKDFGGGYKYTLMIEDAKVTVE